MLGQLYGGSNQVPLVLVQLGFEQLKQGEGVSRTTGEAGNNLVPVQAPDLARITLHDRIAHGDLAIATDHHAVAAAYGENGCSSELFHGVLQSPDIRQIGGQARGQVSGVGAELP